MAERKDSRLPFAAGTAWISENGVVPMARGGALALHIIQYSCRVLLCQVLLVLSAPCAVLLQPNAFLALD